MNKEQLVSRFKSFLWRLGSLAFVMFLSFVADNLELFNLPLQVQAIVALVLGEVTKYLNRNA